MKALSVQFQPDQKPGLDFSGKAAELKMLGQSATFVEQVSIESGMKDDRYVNVDFQTLDVPLLWKMIQSVLGLNSDGGSPFSKAVIVVCEGENGWSDYLLLHHFDDTQPTDVFEESRELPKGVK